MGLKKLLWNDNARELFGTRAGQSDNAPRAVVEPRGKNQARKLAKGSVAFTSALLFGTNESQGLLRTLSQVSLTVPHEDGSSSKARNSIDEDCQIIPDGYHHGGPEGPGDYMGGLKIQD